MKTKAFALLRIAFGLVWAFDAWFKWQPAFISGFVGYFTDAAQGQPAIIVAWISWWVHLVSFYPSAWAVVVALAETSIAFGLIFGILTRVAIRGGIVLALLIWTVPEGFGTLFTPGNTDIGAAIVYVLMFIALWVGECWKVYSIDALRVK